jgi:hypothetical protein
LITLSARLVLLDFGSYPNVRKVQAPLPAKSNIKKKLRTSFSALKKNLATTYSRGSYTTTTIGKAAFDGRVRDGNGSGHSFMVTKKRLVGLVSGL